MTTHSIASPRSTRQLLVEDWPTAVVAAADGRAPSSAAIAAASRLAGDTPFRVVSVVADNEAATTFERQLAIEHQVRVVRCASFSLLLAPIVSGVGAE